MKINLETPNPEMGQQGVDEVNANNIKKMRQTLNKTGVSQLLLKTNTTPTNITSTTYIIPVGMEGAITSTGGWTEINFKGPLDVSGTIVIYGQLVLDGTVVDSEILTIPGGSVNLSLVWRGSLGQGRHTVNVNFKVGSGTAAFSPNFGPTVLQVVEFVI